LSFRSWQSARYSSRCAIPRIAFVMALAMLSGCGDLPTESVPEAGAPPAYTALAARYLEKTLKDRASDDAFEISGLRWAHTMTGWNWLACVRFQDHGHRHTYVLFMQTDAVIDGRYAVQTDACESQPFTQFDLMSGAAGQPTAVQLEPLY
jgi:hypothetical protein